MSRVRLVPIIVIIAVTLLVLFSGWKAYQHFNLVDPMSSRLRAVPGVKSVQITTGTTGKISITLDQVADLQATYLSIQKAISDNTTDTVTQVPVIVDHRNPTLVAAYEALQPYIMEGIAKGNYPSMITTVESKASSMGLKARISMDEHDIYVQISDGSHYLYDILPYTLH